MGWIANWALWIMSIVEMFHYGLSGGTEEFRVISSAIFLTGGWICFQINYALIKMQERR